MSRKIRLEVARFSRAMEKELRENDHKGGWEYESLGWLYKRLKSEVDELGRALGFGCSRCHRGRAKHVHAQDVLSEAADVANFAMMLADNASRLDND